MAEVAFPEHLKIAENVTRSQLQSLTEGQLAECSAYWNEVLKTLDGLPLPAAGENIIHWDDQPVKISDVQEARRLASFAISTIEVFSIPPNALENDMALEEWESSPPRLPRMTVAFNKQATITHVADLPDPRELDIVSVIDEGGKSEVKRLDPGLEPDERIHYDIEQGSNKVIYKLPFCRSYPAIPSNAEILSESDLAQLPTEEAQNKLRQSVKFQLALIPGHVGIEKLHDEQVECIAHTVIGDKVCARITTAGGKTFAQAGHALVLPFGPPIRLHVIVSVSKALALDQHQKVTAAGFRSVIITADVSSGYYIFAHNRIRENDVHIVVTTPEALGPKSALRYLLLEKYQSGNFASISLDEAHRRSSSQITRALPGSGANYIEVEDQLCSFRWAHLYTLDFIRETFLRCASDQAPLSVNLYSATFDQNSLEKLPPLLGLSYPNDFVTIEKYAERSNLEYIAYRLDLETVEIAGERKKISTDVLEYTWLAKYIGETFVKDGDVPRILIFCSTKSECDNVRIKLNENGFPCDTYHSGTPAEHQVRILKRWKGGKKGKQQPEDPLAIVIATVCLASGIDQADIEGVITFGTPFSADVALQQSTRGGRGPAKKHCRCVLVYRVHDYRRIPWMARSNQRHWLERVPELRKIFYDAYREKENLPETFSDEDFVRRATQGRVARSFAALQTITRVDQCLRITLHQPFQSETVTACDIFDPYACSVCRLKATFGCKGTQEDATMVVEAIVAFGQKVLLEDADHADHPNWTLLQTADLFVAPNGVDRTRFEISRNIQKRSSLADWNNFLGSLSSYSVSDVAFIIAQAIFVGLLSTKWVEPPAKNPAKGKGKSRASAPGDGDDSKQMGHCFLRRGERFRDCVNKTFRPEITLPVLPQSLVQDE